ncbi:hypothetical protein M3P36_12465 [Altererythrobacter sp. KTW20L]|uniref:hypothetical protein n=1 Tax=Altererythrobacter sp. KTW20L TaxID=2942210 RepID=UPI0020BF2B07|nr:hypothetical protein [Altererythrobacter sp. KTW20L]MCL6251851.1 hypothetical protein [Altererythrobacter sp. KTW20L]
MKDPHEFVPPFLSPLTHDEHATLGRIAILWGQVDMVLDLLLEATLGISGKQRQALLGEKPIGAKLDILKPLIADIASAETKRTALQFWDFASQTKTQRNRIFHGVWGIRCDGPQKIQPAATHYKDKGNTTKASQLPELERKLCKTARLGAIAAYSLHNLGGIEGGASRLFHGSGPPPPWLQEWKEQHPVDDDALDHRYKEGQLPFLTNPV